MTVITYQDYVRPTMTPTEGRGKVYLRPRGDDPEAVIQQIAQRRARDKSDPQYYARLTVTKARAELQRQSNAEQPGEDQRTPSKAIALDH